MTITSKLLSIGFLLISSVGFAEEALETKLPESSDAEIKGITQRFEADTQNIAKKYEDKASDITPPDHNGVANVVKFDLDISWNITSFKMDIPKFKMKDQKMSFDLPQITMKNKDIKFDIPEVKMVTKVVGKKPEVTIRWVMENVGPIKTKVPKTYVYWTDIKTDIPEVYMNTKKIVTGIPQFKMDTTSIIMGIPVVWMETQEMKLHLPQFKVTNINTEIKETQINANKLQVNAKEEIDNRTSQFKAELSSVIIKKLSAPFDEQKKMIIDQSESIEKQLASAQTLYNESISNLKKQGMQETDPQIILLLKQKTEIETSFANAGESLRKTLLDLTAQQKAAIDDALSKIQS